MPNHPIQPLTLTPEQTSAVILEAAKEPRERRKVIESWRSTLDHSKQPGLQSWGIQVGQQMDSLDARVLPAPTGARRALLLRRAPIQRPSRSYLWQTRSEGLDDPQWRRLLRRLEPPRRQLRQAWRPPRVVGHRQPRRPARSGAPRGFRPGAGQDARHVRCVQLRIAHGSDTDA
jgi:hypothetical protein